MQRVVRSTLVGLLTIAGLTACGDKVTVPVAPTAVVDTTVHSVVVSPASLTLQVGGSATLAAAVDAGQGQAVRTVSWTSSDATVASVGAATGVVTAIKAGTVTITASATANPQVKGAAAVTVQSSITTAPVVTISGVNTTVCGPGGAPPCSSVPANVQAAAGQLDVVLNVEANGQAIKTVEATLTCGTKSMTRGQAASTAGQAASDAAEAAAPVTISFPSNEFNPTTGVPTLNNGPCTISAKATLVSGAVQNASNTQQLTLANADGVVLTTSFAAVTNAEGITPTTTTANDAAGLPWRTGSVTIAAIPVLYNARTISTVSITLPGATTPTQVITAAPFSATWSASATSGARVTGLTLVDNTGCVAPAVPPACGAVEVNLTTPKGVTPTIQAVDANGNDVVLPPLNAGVVGTASPTTFRLDNTAPAAPLGFTISPRQALWAGAATPTPPQPAPYVFASTGPGGFNTARTTAANITSGAANFVGCGDAPNVIASTGASASANPYICPPQLGVSAVANNQTLGFTGPNGAQTTGATKFSYYYILAANYDGPPSASNGTGTSATACDKSKWTKITSAADVPATLVNNAYVVRVFETDALGNARCTDESTALGVTVDNTVAGGLRGSIINTGVSNSFTVAGVRGTFGVDKTAPTAVLVDNSASTPTAASANMVVGIGAPTPSFTVALSDDASGFSATPISTTVTRLAIDATGNPSTVNTAFGCPVPGLDGNGNCSAGDRSATIAADGGSGADFSGCVGCGYFTYTGTARDFARNVAPTLTRQVVIDRLAPTMGSIAVPAGLTGGQPATFLTSAQDNLDLINADFTLTYPSSPSGNPAPGGNFPIRAVGATFHAAFSGTLITSPTGGVSLVTPLFIRTVATTTAAQQPQNNGQLPQTISARAYDAGGNVSVVNAGTGAGFSQINSAAIGQANPTNFAAVQANGSQMTSWAPTNVVANVSNCPAAGCPNGAAPANATTIVLTAAVAGTEGATFQFQNPFSQVQFYYFDTVTKEYVLIGAATSASVTDNATATQRTFSFALPLPFDPPASLGAGPLSVIAVGVNSLGDALASNVSTNITLTIP